MDCPGTTSSSSVPQEELPRLHTIAIYLAERRKFLNFLCGNPPSNLYDNSRFHVTEAVAIVQRTWCLTVLEHPSYSPGMIPFDFDLCPRLKEPLQVSWCSICAPSSIALHRYYKSASPLRLVLLAAINA